MVIPVFSAFAPTCEVWDALARVGFRVQVLLEPTIVLGFIGFASADRCLAGHRVHATCSCQA